MSGIFSPPAPTNEPVLSYAPGSPARAALKAELARLSATVTDIPVIVGGKEIRGSKTVDVVMPHDHKHVIAKVHQADEATVRDAITASLAARREWSAWSFEARAAV